MSKNQSIVQNAAPVLSNLSLKDIFFNTCDAFVNTVADFNSDGNDNEQDPNVKLIRKENRYMYLALLILVLMVIGNILFE